MCIIILIEHLERYGLRGILGAPQSWTNMRAATWCGRCCRLRTCCGGEKAPAGHLVKLNGDRALFKSVIVVLVWHCVHLQAVMIWQQTWSLNLGSKYNPLNHVSAGQTVVHLLEPWWSFKLIHIHYIHSYHGQCQPVQNLLQNWLGFAITSWQPEKGLNCWWGMSPSHYTWY